MDVSPSGGGLLPALLALLFRALAASWRVRARGAELLAEALREGPVVLACWHGEQLALIGAHRDRGFVPMVSLSQDGELLARALPRLGYGVVRGSSSRRGAEALEESLALLRAGRTLALAVDGPRGPAGEPKAGAAVLAARSGRPLLLMAASARPALALRSWDRFRVPLPFAAVELRYERLEAPTEDPAAIEACRQELRGRLRALSDPASTPPAPGTGRPARPGTR